MKDSQPWRINSNDRLAFVGKTGSGKTSASKKLVWEAFEDVIFYDPKRKEYEDLDAVVLQSIDEVHEALFPDDPAEELSKFVYVPDQASPEDLDDLCRLAVEKQNIHLYLDEIKTIYNGSSITPYHDKIMTQGRALGVGCSNSTQRPKRVPLETLSEAEHVLSFKLKIGADRDRMKDVIGSPAGNLRSIDPWWFYYDHDRLDSATLCEPLDL